MGSVEIGRHGILKTRVPVLVAMCLVSLVAGCSSAASPDEPVVATESQVASVIGRYVDRWTDVFDNAAECRRRVEYGIMGDEVSQLRQGCLEAEEAVAAAGDSIADSFAEMNIPASMEGLVSDTLAVLDSVLEADIKGSCVYIKYSNDAATPECLEAMDSARVAYSDLSDVLGGWSPYL